MQPSSSSGYSKPSSSPMRCRLTLERGSLFAVGSLIDEIAGRYLPLLPSAGSHRKSREQRDGAHFHITVVQKKEISTPELEQAVRSVASSSSQDIAVDGIVPLGMGRVHDGPNLEAFFVVVYSEQLSRIRRNILGSETPLKDFHITLGFAEDDIHTKKKTVKTIVPPFVCPSRETFQLVLTSAWRSVDSGKDIDELIDILEFILRALDVASNDDEKLNSIAANRKVKVLDVLCALCAKKGDFNMMLSHSATLEGLSEVRGLTRRSQALTGLGEPIRANFIGLEALQILSNGPKDGDESVKALAFLKAQLSSLDCPVDSRCVNDELQSLIRAESPWMKRTKTPEETLKWANQIHDLFSLEAQQRWELRPDTATSRRCVFDPATGSIHRLPRLFSWIVPQRLCGMSTPRNADDVSAIVNGLGVGLVVSLTAESPLPKLWFEGKPCVHMFLPVDNYEPPSIAQVDEFILSASAMMLRKRATLVHCGGGKGRAGSMLACWLVRMGGPNEVKATEDQQMCVECIESSSSTKSAKVFCTNDGCCFHRETVRGMLETSFPFDGSFSPKQAIDAVQQWRPGSIETAQQEAFIHEYADRLWKRAQQQDDGDCEEQQRSIPSKKPSQTPSRWMSESEALIIRTGKPIKRSSSAPTMKIPSLIVTMGLPGSGKSTLGRLLEKKLSAKRCVVISGDELGGRQAVENAIGNAIKTANAVVYVDRCHVDRESRRRVLDLAFSPVDACLVFMDVPKAECIQRAKARIGHPTIPQGSGATIIESFSKRMEVPSSSEDVTSEGFARMYHIKSHSAFEELCREWGLDTRLGPEDESSDSTTNTTSSTNSAGSGDEESPGSSKAKGLPGFTKFPRTAHLVRMSDKSVSRDDLLIGDASAWLKVASQPFHSVTVEEKIDGANLGISADPETKQLRVQNRSHYVSKGDHPQFSPLAEWLSIHCFEIQSLLQAVEETYSSSSKRVTPILFGEWIVARHSIAYDAIPDYFVAFDILLPSGQFASRKVFYSLLNEHCPSLSVVPTLLSSDSSDGINITIDQLKQLVTSGKSRFRQDGGKLEGVYVRIDDERTGTLKDRSKIVRADFIAGNEHWTKHSLERNVKKVSG